MRFQIQNRERPGSELGTILVGLAERTAEAPRNFSDDAHWAIHSIRTDMKKIRALLPLAESELSAEVRAGILAEARGLKNHYGNLRDEVVLEQLLRRLATPLEAAVLPEIFETFDSQPSPPDAEWIRRAEQLAERLRGLPFWAVTASAMRRAFAKTLRRCVRNRWKCRQLHTDAAFHEWRKSMKILGYQATVLGDPMARQALKISEDLGTANDLANLRLRLSPMLPGTLPEPLRVRIERELADMRKRALDRARSLH